MSVRGGSVHDAARCTGRQPTCKAARQPLLAPRNGVRAWLLPAAILLARVVGGTGHCALFVKRPFDSGYLDRNMK